MKFANRLESSPPATPPLLLTKAELAEELRCSDRQVDNLVQAGELPPPIRLGSSPRWSRQAIESWIEAKSTAPTSNDAVAVLEGGRS
ncbi:MAG: hypothetical protein Fues2KO_24240 [Fuerstiella sp.]